MARLIRQKKLSGQICWKRPVNGLPYVEIRDVPPGDFAKDEQNSRTVALAWEVVSPIAAFPRTLVLNREVAQTWFTVELTSNGRQFHVLGVEGRCVRSYEDVSAHELHARLRLLVEPTPVGEKSRISILTDHPDDAKVQLAVICPPPETRGFSKP